MRMRFRNFEYKDRTSPSKTISSNCGTSVMVDVKAGANCQCTFMKCKETENKDLSKLFTKIFPSKLRHLLVEKRAILATWLSHGLAYILF